MLSYQRNLMTMKKMLCAMQMCMKEMKMKKVGPIYQNESWRYPGSGNTPAGLKKAIAILLPKEWGL